MIIGLELGGVRHRLFLELGFIRVETQLLHKQMPSNPTNTTPNTSTDPNENTDSKTSNTTDTNTDLNPDNIDLDDESYKVLTALNDAGGESDTSEITQKTRLENHVINYRFRKLGTTENGLGLLQTYTQTRKDGELTPPKGVELTEKGKAAIDAGLLDTHDPNPSLEERVAELEAENSALENQLDNVFEDLVMLRKGFIMVDAALSDILDDDEELTDYLPDDVPVSKTDYTGD